jgi:protein transport protein DSL1/ZW10
MLFTILIFRVRRYLLNDTIWLSDQLQDFAAQWKERKDVPERAYRMIRLNPEINKLKSFGNRAYTNELVAQRTIINDLLAGKPSAMP